LRRHRELGDEFQGFINGQQKILAARRSRKVELVEGFNDFGPRFGTES